MWERMAGVGKREEVAEVVPNTIDVEPYGAQISKEEVVRKEKIILCRAGHRHDLPMQVMAVGQEQSFGHLSCLTQ